MPVTVPASTELIVSSKATNERKKNHLEKYKQGVPGEVRPGEDNQKSQDRYLLVGAGQKESRQVGRGSRAGEARSYRILVRWLDGSKSYRFTLQMEAKTPNKHLGLSYEFIKYRKRGD